MPADMTTEPPWSPIPRRISHISSPPFTPPRYTPSPLYDHLLGKLTTTNHRPQTTGVTNYSLPNQKVTNPRSQITGLTSAGSVNSGLTNPSSVNPGHTNPSSANIRFTDLDPQITGVTITGLKYPFSQNVEVSKASSQNPGFTNTHHQITGVTTTGFTDTFSQNAGVTNAPSGSINPLPQSTGANLPGFTNSVSQNTGVQPPRLPNLLPWSTGVKTQGLTNSTSQNKRVTKQHSQKKGFKSRGRLPNTHQQGTGLAYQPRQITGLSSVADSMRWRCSRVCRVVGLWLLVLVLCVDSGFSGSLPSDPAPSRPSVLSRHSVPSGHSVSSRSVPSAPSRPSIPSLPVGQGDGDPLAKLSRVFGIKRIPARIFYHSPPQYMTDLYKEVADRNGLTKANGPYNANTVRSFPDRDTVHQEQFFYNVSGLEESQSQEERMLEAEFHIFKMKPRPSRSAEPRPPHHLQLKVYQVVDQSKIPSPEGLRLLDAQRISSHKHGWITFKVTKAVDSWRQRPQDNQGLLVVAQSSQGQSFSGSYVRFAQRKQHHDSKQPILVIFSDDVTATRRPTFVSPDDQDYKEILADVSERQSKTGDKMPTQQQESPGHEPVTTKPVITETPTTPPPFNRNLDFQQAIRMLNEHARERFTGSSGSTAGRNRRKRQANGGNYKRQSRRRKRMYDVGSSRYRRSCSKHRMYVDFEDIGWSGWIISPKGYDAYHCTGLCPFPLSQSQKPTNHATVQSIVHALGVGTKNLGTPCCVPNKLFSISLLYFDDDENVILKQYDDMVAASCGCH